MATKAIVYLPARLFFDFRNPAIGMDQISDSFFYESGLSVFPDIRFGGIAVIEAYFLYLI